MAAPGAGDTQALDCNPPLTNQSSTGKDWMRADTPVGDTADDGKMGTQPQGEDTKMPALSNYYEIKPEFKAELSELDWLEQALAGMPAEGNPQLLCHNVLLVLDINDLSTSLRPHSDTLLSRAPRVQEVCAVKALARPSGASVSKP